MSQQSRVATAGLVLAITMSSAHGATSWKQALHERLLEQPRICMPAPVPTQVPYAISIASDKRAPLLFALSAKDEMAIARLADAFPNRWGLPSEVKPRTTGYAAAQPYGDPPPDKAEVGWRLFECVFILMSLFVGLSVLVQLVDREKEPHRIDRRRTDRTR